MAFWVIGGRYTDTRFSELADGETLHRYGPFETYDDAKEKWRMESFRFIDEATVRYVIVDDEVEDANSPAAAGGT